MASKGFMQGALILFVSGIFVKIIGFAYQITIVRLIGTEAIGIFNMVFPLYITVMVLSSAGLPLAISKMVSQQIALRSYLVAMKIFKTALLLLVFLSLSCTLLLIIISPYVIKHLYHDSRVIFCFYALIPGIIIVPICSAFRGFFLGLQEMFPPAITQVVEQIVRITLALFLIVKFQPLGIEIIAIGLSISMIAGELAGFIVIFILYKRKTRKLKFNCLETDGSNKMISSRKIILDLFSFGFPTTLTRLTSSMVLTFEASLIPITLQKCGFNINQAASIYGQFSGVSLALLTIPTVITFSLATSLVPSISEAEAQGKFHALKFRSTEALRITYLVGLPVTVVLLLKASSLSDILFNLPEAGTTIRYLAWGAVFLYLAQTSNGILQGLGMVNKILINTIAGAVVKVIGILYLVKIPELNINGAAVAFVLSFIVVCILNLRAINKKTGFSLHFKQIVLPFLASLLMTIVIFMETKYLTPYLSNDFITILSIITGVLSYLVLVVFWGQINFKYISSEKKETKS